MKGLSYAISKILTFSNKGHFQRKHIISLSFSPGALFNWSPRDLTMAKAYMQYNLSTAYTMRGEYEKAMLNLTKVSNLSMFAVAYFAGTKFAIDHEVILDLNAVKITKC